MTMTYLDFEAPIEEIHNKLEELRTAKERGVELPVKDIDEEIEQLEVREKMLLRRLYRNLSAWQKVQVSRHPDRPHVSDFIAELITDFKPLAGDRSYADDPTMKAGIGWLNGTAVAVLGTEKGRGTRERVKHNFGMPKPEGYRKAKRIMEMADRFNMPLITFVDTPGAFPGVDAEARGQSEAIASCIETLLKINVPVISVITGEGGSGGALAIAVADRVLMLQNSIYSIISPEGCASILWRDAANARDAAEALKLTADDLFKLGVIDEVIKEPVGGAHRNPSLVCTRVKKAILQHLEKGEFGRQHRREKFLKIDGMNA